MKNGFVWWWWAGNDGPLCFDCIAPAAFPVQIEEARRREQADKIAAINALERQSKEIMRHKQVGHRRLCVAGRWAA